MVENFVSLCFKAGEVGVTLGDNFLYWYAPFDMDIMYVDVAPNANDADLTLDINDDGSAAIAAISCAVAATPGQWKTKAFGGAETPVRVAAGSKMSFDLNGAAIDTAVKIQVWAALSTVHI